MTGAVLEACTMRANDLPELNDAHVGRLVAGHQQLVERYLDEVVHAHLPNVVALIGQTSS